jgi:hypothetical protein
MTSQIEEELRAAFEAASDFVQPRSGLADRVRSRSRMRRRRKVTTGLVAATACALAAAGASYLAGQHQTPPVHRHSVASTGSHHRSRHSLGSETLAMVPSGYGIDYVGANGPYLYTMILSRQGSGSLAVYLRADGSLIRKVAMPRDFIGVPTVGPDGLVWVSLWSYQGSAASTWLFSPNLRQHSTGPGVKYGVATPVGRTTALIPQLGGLLKVQMPAPGSGGRATSKAVPGTSLGAGVLATDGSAVSMVDGRAVADMNASHRYYLTIAGDPSVTYGNSLFPIPPSERAVSGGSIWAVIGAGSPLVRLDGQLRPTTPAFVRADRALSQTDAVWAYGSTIWVVTGTASKSLACFPARGLNGPVTTMPVKLPAHELLFYVAAEGQTVYVTTGTSSALPRTVTRYPVPTACR